MKKLKSDIYSKPQYGGKPIKIERPVLDKLIGDTHGLSDKQKAALINAIDTEYSNGRAMGGLDATLNGVNEKARYYTAKNADLKGVKVGQVINDMQKNIPNLSKSEQARGWLDSVVANREDVDKLLLREYESGALSLDEANSLIKGIEKEVPLSSIATRAKDTSSIPLRRGSLLDNAVDIAPAAESSSVSSLHSSDSFKSMEPIVNLKDLEQFSPEAQMLKNAEDPRFFDYMEGMKRAAPRADDAANIIARDERLASRYKNFLDYEKEYNLSRPAIKAAPDTINKDALKAYGRGEPPVKPVSPTATKALNVAALLDTIAKTSALDRARQEQVEKYGYVKGNIKGAGLILSGAANTARGVVGDDGKWWGDAYLGDNPLNRQRFKSEGVLDDWVKNPAKSLINDLSSTMMINRARGFVDTTYDPQIFREDGPQGYLSRADAKEVNKLSLGYEKDGLSEAQADMVARGVWNRKGALENLYSKFGLTQEDAKQNAVQTAMHEADIRKRASIDNEAPDGPRDAVMAIDSPQEVISAESSNQIPAPVIQPTVNTGTQVLEAQRLSPQLGYNMQPGSLQLPFYIPGTFAPTDNTAKQPSTGLASNLAPYKSPTRALTGGGAADTIQPTSPQTQESRMYKLLLGERTANTSTKNFAF